MILKFLPYNILFFWMLLLSLLISLNSNNWLFLWVGLEMNLLSFIPLASNSSSNLETEGAIKYFLTQAIGSGILIICILMKMLPFDPSTLKNLTTLFILFSLLMKTGMAPCHFWFPQVMSSLSWVNCLILSSLQKMNPLFIIIMILTSWEKSLIIPITIMNSLVGGIGGINQTQMRPILAYSSIGHMSWIVSASPFSFFLSFVYFMFYILITMSLILIMYKLKKMSTNEFNITFQLPLFLSLILFINMLSLAGLPPLLGFMPKWIVMSILSLHFPLLLIPLILGSLINLFYYLMIFFSMILNNMKSMKFFTPNYNYISLWITTVAPLFLLPSIFL
uniref:NADH dehydrogenase subunit 2 n=1 Tax=Clavisyllis tenjini TaxID=3041283 RepID=UPI002551E5C0|nr:NADH dehydrogenase subunit 2 [Clavisyllis tenjini]WGF21039.1 NADH dehydrogenase subunit 2 [Clavisyllis tenjini]